MFTRIITTTIALSLAAALAGCLIDDRTDGEFDSFIEEITIGAGDAALVLDFLNNEATNLWVLDDVVGLNSRAASNIISHRDGADGQYPSADDDRFDTLEELDAISYVGPAAFDTIVEYVISNPGASGEIVEGVEFSSTEAEAVVWGVNRATLELLDDVVGLSSRAANNLFDAAPFTTVSQMGAVSYVGPSALGKLRDYAVVWRQELLDELANSMAGTYDGVVFDADTARVAFDIANEASFNQMYNDGGFWKTGASRIVASRPYADLAAVAGTTGIGPATMQDLYDFAASGTWTGPEQCTQDLTVSTDPVVTAYAQGIRDYDQHEDYLKFNLGAWTVDTCNTIEDPLLYDNLFDTLIDHAYFRNYWTNWPGLFTVGNVVSGSAQFRARLAQSLDQMRDELQERLAAGEPDAQQRFDELEALYNQVDALTTGAPGTIYSFRIDIDLLECSQHAELMIDTSTGLVMALHRGPYC